MKDRLTPEEEPTSTSKVAEGRQEKGSVVLKSSLLSTKAEFSGPLPPPEILQGYERILPGSADRIISMAERQSEHRQALERKVVEGGIDQSRLGLVCAFAVAIFGLGIGLFTALKGQPFFGGAVSIFIIASLVGAFIYGTRQQRERQKKDRVHERE